MFATSHLAVFGGEKAVTATVPPWPCYAEDEMEAVRQSMIRMGVDMAEVTSRGETVTGFEKRFAESLGRKYAVTTSGGGPALHIACMAGGIQMGG